MDRADFVPEPYPSEIEHLEAELRGIMLRLIDISPDAILRIERIFQKVRIERIVEKQFH